MQSHATFWERGGYTCFEGAHLGLTIVSTLCAAALLTLCALFTLLFYDSHPLTSDLAGKAHGRAEFGMLLIRSLLVIGVQTAGPYVGAWPVIAMLVVGGAAWLTLYAYFMPFTHHAINTTELAGAAVYTYASLCLVAGAVRPSFDAAIALYLGGPLAALAGVWLAGWRRATIMVTPLVRMSSPFEVELKARYLVQAALRADGEGTHAGTTGARTAAVAGGQTTRQLTHRVGTTRTGRGGTSTGELAGGEARDLAHIAYANMDVDSRAVAVRSTLPPALLAKVEELYRGAVLLWPQSTMLQVRRGTWDRWDHLGHASLLATPSGPAPAAQARVTWYDGRPTSGWA